MRRNSLACFTSFLFLIISRVGTSSTSDRDNLFHKNDLVSLSNSNNFPTIDYSCLYVSPDLPPCPFNRNENSQRFHRSLDEINEGIKLTFEEHVTVYAIQGCVPSRLPFKMALCESKKSLERATKIWKLYPFQGTEEERRNSFVFPRFDLERWTREMKLLEKEEHGKRNEEKTIGKSDPEDSFVPSEEYFPATVSVTLGSEDEERSVVSSIFRSHSRENRTDERRRRRRRRRRDSGRTRRKSEHLEGRESSKDRRKIRKVRDFPYFESIPFDPTGLGHDKRSKKFVPTNVESLLSRRSRDIKLGSEFPYWKAKPYDSKIHKFYGIVADDHRVGKLS